MNIEVGGGHLVPVGTINLDPVHGTTAEWRRYAQHVPWPTPDGSVNAVRASHVMEHIPAGPERIAVMNEAHRVLAPGGTLEIIVPLLVGTWHAVADPTHVSFWIRESFYYFTGFFAPNADYGIRPWEEVSWELVGAWEGHWIGTPR